MNFYHYFKSIVLRFPEKTAFCFQDKRYTYREFDNRVCRLASAMKNFGIEPGMRVGLFCSNSNAYVEIVLAASMIGAVSEQYNWRISPSEMTELMKDSPAEILFFSSDHRNVYEELKQSLPRPVKYILADGECSDCISYESLLKNSLPLSAPAERKAEDPAFIYFTSGTTSRPKRVILSLGSFCQHQMTNLYELGWRSDDVCIHALPLFHTTSSSVYCALMCGAAVVLLPRFDAENWLKAAKEEHVTCAGLVPNIIDWLSSNPGFCKENLPDLRWILYGGSPMSIPVLKRSIELMGNIFIQMYGMTEMCPSVTVFTPEAVEHFLVSGQTPLPNGRPLLGIQLMIVDDNDRPQPPHTVGEIVVKSHSMMSGYEGRQELTEHVLRGGWYHTRDLGYVDENGYLYLTGRKNRMIITGGENVYPSQVEDCIQNMSLEIKECAVFSIPDKKWGETVAALVVLNPESTLGKGDICEYCRQHLPGYMKPRHLRIVDEIPHNESGKVDYPALKKYILPN